MAIFTLTSALGSPGVTTTAVALAVSWPRPVTLVEADPTGGSSILAGFFRGTVDQPGAIHLAMAHRQGQLASVLPTLLLPIDGTRARLLAGTRSHDQAVGLEAVWEPLLGVLRGLVDTGQDVIVDAGRLGLDGSPTPLVWGADVTVLVTRSSLPAVAGARSWARTLRDRTAPTRVLVVGEDRPYATREVAAAVETPAVGAVVWSPRVAAVFAEGEDYPAPGRWGRLFGRRSGPERFARSAYLRSVTAVGESLRRLAGGVPEAAEIIDEERVR